MRVSPVVFVVVVGGLGMACGSRHLDRAPAPNAGRLPVGTPMPMAEDAPPPPELPPLTMPSLERSAVCAMRPGAVGKSSGSRKPFTAVDPDCPPSKNSSEPTYWCDRVDAPPNPKDTCFVADKNLKRAERESRVVKPRAGSAAGGGGASPTWNKTSRPLYWDKVDGHLHLDAREEARLAQNGFVVMESHPYSSYGVAFHDVFQQQLPVYISADAILNAVFQANQTLLEEVERTQLVPKLVTMLARLRGELPRSRATLGSETATDLDLYLTVANRLLVDSFAQPKADAAGELVEQVKAASGIEEVTLFGRPRMIDFSQFSPRGHYAGGNNSSVTLDANAGTSIEFSSYFRAMMWLSRLELNLVSRGCRSSQPGAIPDRTETPREARVALALAELVRRSGTLADLRAFEEVYSVFGGHREDVSIPDLLELESAAKIDARTPDAPAKLRAAIGNRFRRTARTHVMPEGAGELPAIATLFGPRIAPDILPLTQLVTDAVPGRLSLGAPDVAYVLGQDRGKTYLVEDRKQFPKLDSALAKARESMADGVRTSNDVYGTWLRSVLALGRSTEGVVPSFMKTDAWADARMSTALAAYAQIRHTFVLLSGQGYDSYGCEIPDGWVEPALAMYEALFDWVKAARRAVPSQRAYFDRVEAVLEMLHGIVKTELSGAALSEPQKRWLGMVTEHIPLGGYQGDSHGPPKYTGWYFDLFPDRYLGAERRVDVIADYFTLTNVGEVRYLGIDKAALGVFVVDVGGAPRAMVGPVVVPYAQSSTLAKRLDDEAARSARHPRAPWLGYAVPPASEPTLDAEVFVCDADARVVVRSPSALGPVSVTLLDHHGDPLASPVTVDVEADPAVFAFALPAALLTSPRGIEGLHVRVHDRSRSNTGTGRFDKVSGVSSYASVDPLRRPERFRAHLLQLGRIATRDPSSKATPEDPALGGPMGL